MTDFDDRMHEYIYRTTVMEVGMNYWNMSFRYLKLGISRSDKEQKYVNKTNVEYIESFVKAIKDLAFSEKDIPLDEYDKMNGGHSWVYVNKANPKKRFTVDKDYMRFKYRGVIYMSRNELKQMLETGSVTRDYKIPVGGGKQK